MKDREPWDAWEKELHRELTALPDLRAPSTLIPGVLSRLPAPTAAAWPATSWWQWPLALRIASAVVVIVCLAGLAWVTGSFMDLRLGQRLAEAHTSSMSGLAFFLDRAESFLGPHATFWRRHGQMILIASATLLLGIYLTGIAAGSALYRLAWRRIS